MLALIFVGGCSEAVNKLIPMNPIARMLYSDRPTRERTAALSEYIQAHLAYPDKMARQLTEAGYEEKRPISGGCRFFTFEEALSLKPHYLFSSVELCPKAALVYVAHNNRNPVPVVH